MSAPTIETVRTAIAAASSVKSLRVRAMHAATARAQLTALRAAIESAEIVLADMERDLARSTAQGATWGGE